MSQSNISLETLAQYFHLPITEVARKLGVCATVLKKICRKNGIPRWPHRKIKSIDKSIANLRLALSKNPEDAERIEEELRAILARKEQLMKNPSLFAVSKSGSSKYKGSGGQGKRKGQRGTSGSASDDSFDSPSSLEATYNQPAPSPVISSAYSTRRKSINSTLAAMDFEELQLKAMSPYGGGAAGLGLAMDTAAAGGEAPKRNVRFAPYPSSMQDEDDEDSDVDIEDGDEVMADDEEEEEDENFDEYGDAMMQDNYEERVEYPPKFPRIRLRVGSPVAAPAPSVEGPGGETLQSATFMDEDQIATFQAAEQGNVSAQESSAWSDNGSPNSNQPARRKPASRRFDLGIPKSPTRAGVETVPAAEGVRRTQRGREIKPPRSKSISASRPYGASLAQRARREREALAPRWQTRRGISREENESGVDDFDEGEEEEGAKLMAEMRRALYQQQKERQQVFMSALWQQQQQQMAASQYWRRHSFPAAYPYPGYFPVYSGGDGSPTLVYYVPAPPPPASYTHDIRRSSMMYVPPASQVPEPAPSETAAPAPAVAQPETPATSAYPAPVTSPRANIEPSEHSAFVPVSPRSGAEPVAAMGEAKPSVDEQATEQQPIAAPTPMMVFPKAEEMAKAGSPPQFPLPSAPVESPAPTPSPPLQFYPGSVPPAQFGMQSPYGASSLPMGYPPGVLPQSTAFSSPYWYQQQRFFYPQMMMAQQAANPWGYPGPYGAAGSPAFSGAPIMATTPYQSYSSIPPDQPLVVPSEMAPISPVAAAGVTTPTSPKEKPVIWHSPYTMAIPPPGIAVEETKPTLAPSETQPTDAADSMQVCEPEPETAQFRSSPMPPLYEVATLSGGEALPATAPSASSA